MNIDKALKKAYEDLPIGQLPSQHVTALQGISDRMADLLKDAFGVTTIADLANLKFAEWAQAIVELAPKDNSDALARDAAIAQRLADVAASEAADNAAAAAAQQAASSSQASTSTPTVSKSKSTKGDVPALWRFTSGSSAFGVFVDDSGCWMGNQKGQVFHLDHDANVIKQFKLPKGVMCLVADGKFTYAGCDDGNVYDLTGDHPMVAYTIEKSTNIYWIDIIDGNLGVGDSKGTVAAFDFEQQQLFKTKSNGTSCWMIRCDKDAVYVGNSYGVEARNWADGSEKWSHRLKSSVLFGWQEKTTLYAGCSDNKVHQLTKDGKVGRSYVCDRSVYSCSASEDGKYVFAGDSSGNVYCFDEAGTRLWKLRTDASSALSMQYHNQRLYVVTSNGSFICIDASPEGIAKAKAGTATTARKVSAPTTGARAARSTVDSTSDSTGKVIVECYKEGSRLRVRPVSAGYNHDWHIQFPRALREDGVKFVVDELVECGNFYRARGSIKRLDS
ncbi:MAG: hypothetical protein ACI8RZ_003157 [Myxococcota bacterium]|jgi:hypothetical protein